MHIFVRYVALRRTKQRRALTERFPFPERLKLFDVVRSERELNSVVDAVSDSIPQLRDEGIVVHLVARSIPENVVEIHVAVADPETERKLGERFGADRIRVIQGSPWSDLDRYSDPFPLKAGVYMTNAIPDTTTYCTTNWGLRSTETSKKYRLTAGHCFTSDTKDMWQHNGTNIGPYQNESYYDESKFDGGFIETTRSNDDANDLLYLAADSYRDMDYVQDRTADEVGNLVCMQGVATDGICGYITDRYAATSVGGVDLRAQRIADFVAQKGDSGGGVYTGLTMKGIQSRSDLKTRSSYSHIDYLTDYFSNKRVITNSSGN